MSRNELPTDFSRILGRDKAEALGPDRVARLVDSGAVTATNYQGMAHQGADFLQLLAAD